MLNAKLYQITRTRTDIESKEQFSKMLLYTTSDEGFPAVYINGGNIAANSIYGKSIQANTIDAEHLQANIISSDHISAAGITADNIKGSTLKSIKELSEGGSFIDLDSGNFNFAGGNLTWDNTNKRFYINASHIQIGNKDVLNTGSDLAQQINNGPTRIEGNALHFTNNVLIDNGFIDKLNANQAFIQTLDAIEIDASQITSGSINADIIEVYNLNASNLKAGTLDGDLITVRNLSADAITTGTLDMDKFNVVNLSADYIKGGNLDISGGVRITSGNHLVMEVDPETMSISFNVNRLSVGPLKVFTEEDIPDIKEEIESKVKFYTHVAFANSEDGSVGFSLDSKNKEYMGIQSNSKSQTPSDNYQDYIWTKIKGETGPPGESPYLVDIISSNGLVFKNGVIDTWLIAVVYHGNKDVTEELDSNRFRWTRISRDQASDIIWNNKYFGGSKEIKLTIEDIYMQATFQVEILAENGRPYSQ